MGRHHGHAEDFPGQGFDFIQRLHQFYAVTLAVAAAWLWASDYNRKTRQILSYLPGFSRGEGNAAFGDIYIKVVKKRFGLIRDKRRCIRRAAPPMVRRDATRSWKAIR
jgi:hypothetical protein